MKKTGSEILIIIVGLVLLFGFMKSLPFSVANLQNGDMIVTIWDSIGCVPIQANKVNTYYFQEKAQRWGLWYEGDKLFIGNGDNEYTKETKYRITLTRNTGSAGGNRYSYRRCNADKSICTDWIYTDYQHILEPLKPGEYYELELYGTGYIEEIYDAFGIQDTVTGDILNSKNCNLAGIDLERVCQSGEKCKSEGNLSNLNLDFYAKRSYVKDYVIGLYELNKVKYNGQDAYCDPSKLTIYGFSEYTSVTGNKYKYVDGDKVLAKVECCPSMSEFCGSDFKIHTNIQENKTCYLEGQIMSSWSFSLTDKSEVIRGICRNGKIVYETKQTVCNQCKADEICHIDQTTGNTECVKSSAGYNFGALTGSDKYKIFGGIFGLSDMFIIILIFALIVLILLWRRY